MTMRLRYLPLDDAREGMVLGAPLVVAERGVMTYHLPAGHELTDSNLRQLRVRHAEFVCIQEPDERSDDAREAEQLAQEQRLHHIFRLADLKQPAVAGLFDAVLRFRRA